MKIIIYILLFFPIMLSAQFRSETEQPIDIKSGIVNNNPSGFLLDFINPENFQMNHSVGMSYTSGSGHGVALGVYTNNIFYTVNEDLNLNVETSFVNSPYSSFGAEHQKQINGVYISRAAVNYRPWKNTYISLQYRSGPSGYYNPYGYGFGNHSYRQGFIQDRDDPDDPFQQ